jgi:NACalpha-BTF3-like transcription factor
MSTYFDEEEIECIMNHASCTREQAIQALAMKPNVVDAIIYLKSNDVQQKFDEEEIECIMNQTGCNREEAIQALKIKPDFVDAIIYLKNKYEEKTKQSEENFRTILTLVLVSYLCESST